MDKIDWVYHLQNVIGEDLFQVESCHVSYFQRALTHPSMINQRESNYERIEFLGDRVLGLVVAELLYHTYPSRHEGFLAKAHAWLVSKETLSTVALNLNILPLIYMSEAERKGGGTSNSSLVADAMEALIGALYLSSNYDIVKKFIERHWISVIQECEEEPVQPKTFLQEWSQSQGKGLPSYRVKNIEGPDHHPIFTITLVIDGYEPLEAQGSTKKLAERNAAKKFLQQLGAFLNEEN